VNAVELSDFRSFGAAVVRSRRIRLVLLALAVAAAVAAYLAAPRTTAAPDPLLAKGASTVVVVDVSASISWDTYARIASTLDRMRRGDGKVGLVLFSDTAYLALPPATPASELGTYERFFVVKQPSQPGFEPQPPPSPWTSTFSAGTRISTGLELALNVIREDGLRHPRVVLISDLNDDTTDLESLTSAALAYRKLGIPITVAALNPAPQDTQTMARLLPRGGSIVDIPLSSSPTARPQQHVPWRLVGLAVLLALALGSALLVTQRLRWTTP
jgi:hypothetical protein